MASKPHFFVCLQLMEDLLRMNQFLSNQHIAVTANTVTVRELRPKVPLAAMRVLLMAHVAVTVRELRPQESFAAT